MFLYVLEDPDKLNRCKVGITKNPDQRIRPYRTSNPDCYFYKIFRIPDNNYRFHEREILTLLKDVFKVRSEYVYGSSKMISNIIECYLEDNDISI